MPESTRALVAEFLGSFVLLFIGGLSILASGGDLVALSFGFGLALLAGLYAFGEVSGGHYNPAVSIAMYLDNRLDTNQLIQYIVAQVGGAVVAGVALLAASSQAAVAGTATVPSTDAGGAFLLELIGTAIFVAVILKVTRSEANAGTVMLSIALTLVAIHLAMAPISGASVNPARTIGSALIGNEWSDFWLFIVGPVLGSGLGWAFFRASDSGDFSRSDA